MSDETRAARVEADTQGPRANLFHTNIARSAR